MTPEFATYPSLENKCVFISGGASGIGAELVRAFAAQKSKVGFVDIDGEAAEKLSADIDGDVAWAQCDLRNIDQLKSSFQKLQDAHGPATVLINNAARDDRHNWRDVTEEYYDAQMATNMRHQFFAIQAVAPGMIESGGGSIINMGSSSWWECIGNMPVYTTSKAAVHGLTRTMARDLGGHNIRVNTVVPGWVMTERQKELWVTPEAIKARKARQCLPTLIDPIYVANMAMFLASDDSAMCTANNFMVEAGSI